MSHFNILSESLHTTGEGAIDHFKSSMGLKSIVLESQVVHFERSAFRPTIQGTTADGSRYCIDIVERLRVPGSVSQFLETCRQNNSPIKFIIVIPAGAEIGDPEFASNLRRCRDIGVGVFSIEEDGTGIVFQCPLSQAAVGVRRIECNKYPQPYRADLHAHMETYHNGNPVKACQGVAEILEDLTRRVAKKAIQKQLLPHVNNIDRIAWASLCEELLDGLSRNDSSGRPTDCKLITKKLISRIHGYTDHRNIVSHKPKNIKELKDRDQKIRTYFEQGSDLLLELILASKKLRP